MMFEKQFLSFSFSAYKDLSHRKTAREKMWLEPGWGDCVANTGKLIHNVCSKAYKPHPNTHCFKDLVPKTL